MSEWWWIVASIVMVGLALAMVVWTPLQGVVRRARLTDAQRSFHWHREWLEAKFVELASAKQKPDGPTWGDCDFENDVAYVRNRSTGELAAFVGVTVVLEGLEDAEERGSESAGHFREGTAVFRLDRRHWETDGVVLFNLSPAEVVRFYKDNLEIVARELAKH